MIKRIIIVAVSALCIMTIAGCSQALNIAEINKTIAAKEKLAFAYVHDWSEPKEPSGMIRIKQEMDDKAAKAEAERIAAEEAAVQEAYEYYEPVYYGGNDYGNPFKSDGVAEDGRYSYGWYSQNVLPGGGLNELNANGRHVDDSTGYVVDGDGYIAVAMDGVDKGTIVETPWGEAKVYDRVEGDDAPYTGFVDVYTDF